MTPEHYAMLAATINHAAEIEADLKFIDDRAPSALQIVVNEARGRAVKAAEVLFFCDPHDANTVMNMQNEIRLFIDVVRTLRGALRAADAAEQEMDEMSVEERGIVRDLVLGEDDEDGES